MTEIVGNLEIIESRISIYGGMQFGNLCWKNADQ